MLLTNIKNINKIFEKETKEVNIHSETFNIRKVVWKWVNCSKKPGEKKLMN